MLNGRITINLTRSATLVTISLGILAAVGCGGKPYQVALVDGVVIIRGQPGSKIRVQFIPDIDKSTNGPASSAITDEQGRFTLELKEDGGASARPGAVVGHHRVVLSDLQLAASATGQGVPIRLKPEYSLPGSTPLKQEVKPEKQTIEIKVP
jgi:hypothetical protein